MTKDQLLLAYTGRGSAYWVEFIQREIQGTQFGEHPEAIHPPCDNRWLQALVDEVAYQHRAWMTRPRRFERFRKPRQPYDENISTAFILATILSTWAVRLSRGKAHDARRPLELRRVALARNRQLVAALHDAVYDESRDAEYFELPWQYPHMPGATDGSFV